jgi:5-methylcytosine-specific restriction endonuclease McrA
VKVVSWRKAIILWLQGKVEVLEFHTQTVSSPSRTFNLPSVIRLKSYIRPYFSMTVRLSRQNIFIRDQLTCQYCLKQISEKRLTIDHVLPLSKGGRHEWTNVVAACSACNNRKGSRTPEQASMALNRTPVIPKWLPSQELDVRPDRMPSAWEPYLKVIRNWS